MHKELRWYAVYTRSRYEKRAQQFLRENQKLQENGTEVYLPLVKKWRIWSDRKKQVEMPLLPSYIFVRTNPENPHTYFDILNTPGIVRFITFEGKPVAIPDWQIKILQRLNEQGIDMDCLNDSPPPGTPVKVTQGSMKGFTGEVVHVGKNKQLILRLDALDKCVTLKIPLAMVEKDV